jgi:iron complex transport system substrate-binding protein
MFDTADAAGGYAGEHIIGPARRVICMSSSHVAMLDALGCADCIVGVSGKSYISTPSVAESSTIGDVGYDSNLNFELMVALEPDVVLLYGIAAESSSVTAKLRELKIPYIYLGDYTEGTPLGKAEWLVPLAEIVGCRERGERLFTEIATRYEALCEMLSRNPSSVRVMLNTPYQDVWYMPSDDSYIVRLIEDAGATYIYKGKNPTGGSRGISLEEAYRLVAEADVWLNVGQCNTLDELRSQVPQFMECRVVREGRIYNNNRRQTASGGSDFWESAIVHPDIVLEDLAEIFANSDKPLYYHKRIE